MIAFLKKFLKPDTSEFESKQRYVELVAQARAPFLFQECALPDSLDGRFEAIILHLFITEQRLPDTTESMLLIRNLHESFFEDMDRGLREGGVGDTGIGKRVKRMAAGLYGRLQAYRDAISDPAAFKAALVRNAYATCEPPPAESAVNALADYVVAQIAVA